MSTLSWLRRLGSESQSKNGGTLILPPQDQIKAWRKASRKMEWGITQNEFDHLQSNEQWNGNEIAVKQKRS